MIDRLEIRKVFIFSAMNDGDIDSILNVSRRKTYNKGDIIFFDTEPYRGFYVVLKGMVKIYKISNDGREHILHIVEQFSTFAEVPLFENAGKILNEEFTYPANAMVLSDTADVLLIPSRAFINLLEHNPQVSIKMISGFAKRLRELNTHIENISLKDVTRRVANFILSEYNSHKKKSAASSDIQETEIKLKISKNDMASYLGTIPETLSRTFKKLQDEGIIDVEGKTIIIKDLHELKQLVF
jgi:CRP-like cAMP-binding protein